MDSNKTPITQNTLIPLGLLATIVTGFIYAEHRMTTVEEGLNEAKDKVKKIDENFVPRKEYESNFYSLQKQLDRIEDKIDKNR